MTIEIEDQKDILENPIRKKVIKKYEDDDKDLSSFQAGIQDEEFDSINSENEKEEESKGE